MLKFKDEVCHGSKVKVNVKNIEGFGEAGDRLLWNLTLAAREGREEEGNDNEVIQSGEYEFGNEEENVEVSSARNAKNKKNKTKKKDQKKNKVRFTVQTKDVSV